MIPVYTVVTQGSSQIIFLISIFSVSPQIKVLQSNLVYCICIQPTLLLKKPAAVPYFLMTMTPNQFFPFKVQEGFVGIIFRHSEGHMRQKIINAQLKYFLSVTPQLVILPQVFLEPPLSLLCTIILLHLSLFLSFQIYWFSVFICWKRTLYSVPVVGKCKNNTSNRPKMVHGPMLCLYIAEYRLFGYQEKHL